MIKNSIREKDLLASVLVSDINTVNQCIEEGISIDTHDIWGRTALMIASGVGNLSMVKYLVGAGASIDMVTFFIYRTALMIASYDGYHEVVKYLVEVGADTSMQDESGFTALRFAVLNNQYDVIEVLENVNEYLLRKRLGIENGSDVIKDSCIF